MNNKTVHVSVALKALALAGLLVFAAQPAMALDSPDVVVTTTTPTIDNSVPDTATSVDVADDIVNGQHVEVPEVNVEGQHVEVPEVNAAGMHVETPEVVNVSTPSVSTPNVSTPHVEVEGVDR